jgi:hypothetical protein
MTPHPTLESKKKGLQQSAPWIFSVAVHGAILLAIGGAVVTSSVYAPQLFEAVSVTPVSTQQMEAPPDHFLDEVAQSDSMATDAGGEPAPAAEASFAADSMELVVSSAPTQLPPVMSGSGVVAGTVGIRAGTGTGTATGSGAAPGPVGPGRRGGSLFGFKEQVEPSTIQGTLFDFKQTKDRQAIAGETFFANIREFVQNGQNPRTGKGGFKRRGSLDRFYSAPTKLYATHLHIFGISADEAPKAFEVAETVEPRNWIIHYAAMVRPPKSGWYRFIGSADDYIVVGWEKEVILDNPIYGNPQFLGTRIPKPSGGRPPGQPWPSTVNTGSKVVPAASYPSMLAYSDWINMSDSREYRLDVVIGERPGGGFHANLMIEELGVEYPASPEGVPMFPIFKTVQSVELPPAKNRYPASPDGPVFKATPVADPD